MSRFECRIVGGREHEELWVPAEELDEFNSHIERPIDVDAAYFGNGFIGLISEPFGLRGKDAVEQFICLRVTADDSGMDFYCETYVQRRIIYCHYPFWRENDFTSHGMTAEQRDDLISRLEKRWEISDIPFPPPSLKQQHAKQGREASANAHGLRLTFAEENCSHLIIRVAVENGRCND